jgi:hypothetical protein
MVTWTRNYTYAATLRTGVMEWSANSYDYYHIEFPKPYPSILLSILLEPSNINELNHQSMFIYLLC